MNQILAVFSVCSCMTIVMSLSSCTGDLDQYPHIEQTPKDIYTSVSNYRQVMAKLYGSYVLAGQNKGGGNVDISGSRGFDYMRCYFNLQEVGTDEAAMVWHASDNQTSEYPPCNRSPARLADYPAKIRTVTLKEQNITYDKSPHTDKGKI